MAALTGRPPKPLNPDNGLEGPRTVVFINEAWCIGCTLCIKACPTDAIVGANKLMHTVMEQHCTGCELCIPACPVDCMALENASGQATGWAAWSAPLAQQARARYQQHRQRVPLEDAEEEPAEATGESAPDSASTPTSAADARKAAIAAAMERARQRREQNPR